MHPVSWFATYLRFHPSLPSISMYIIDVCVLCPTFTWVLQIWPQVLSSCGITGTYVCVPCFYIDSGHLKHMLCVWLLHRLKGFEPRISCLYGITNVYIMCQVLHASVSLDSGSPCMDRSALWINLFPQLWISIPGLMFSEVHFEAILIILVHSLWVQSLSDRPRCN